MALGTVGVGTVATATTSTVAVGVTVVATLVVVALVVAALSVVRSARALRRAAEDLAQRTTMLIDDVGATVSRAGAELERVEDLVGSAETITETVGAASRLAYVALSNPLIKIMALGRGTSRASARWRRSRGRSDRQRRQDAVAEAKVRRPRAAARR
ncbi:MAG: hypothetical protein M3Y36_10460 [Actinomycetota bacterium]|nr:hypothetical protein [Actinomycetota bacterium]